MEHDSLEEKEFIKKMHSSVRHEIIWVVFISIGFTVFVAGVVGVDFGHFKGILNIIIGSALSAEGVYAVRHELAWRKNFKENHLKKTQIRHESEIKLSKDKNRF